MKLIQYLIIAIFIISGILGILLFRQKTGRINEQLGKRELGWNPVTIKKMCVVKNGFDTLWLVKQNGIWKSNRHFDGMGIAQQLLIYLSTMQIQPVKIVGRDSIQSFKNPILVCSFDKSGLQTNHILIGNDMAKGKSYAYLNHRSSTVILSSSNNNLSIRMLIESFISLN